MPDRGTLSPFQPLLSAGAVGFRLVFGSFSVLSPLTQLRLNIMSNVCTCPPPLFPANAEASIQAHAPASSVGFSPPAWKAAAAAPHQRPAAACMLAHMHACA
eukprot:157146-Chlamydomonas_euryale.AAC.8